MPIAQVVSGLVQTVTPSLASGLFHSAGDGSELSPKATSDFYKALGDPASPFNTLAFNEAYNGVNSFGVYDKDETLDGTGLS